MGHRVPRDIADLDIVEALRTNPRRLAAGDMRNLLREAAEEIETLRARLPSVSDAVGTYIFVTDSEIVGREKIEDARLADVARKIRSEKYPNSKIAVFIEGEG